MKFVEFITNCRRQFINGKFPDKKFPLVIGNSGGDMDSIVCTLGYSYLNFKKRGNIIWPIISFPREDLKLRRDIVYALEKIGLKEDDLIYWPDVYQKGTKNIEAVLVDHNAIDNEWLKGIECKVVGILDHHEDAKQHLDLNFRIIEVSGSCSSLLFREFKPEISKIMQQIDTNDDDDKVREFFVSALLLDTDCLTRRVEEVDQVVWKTIFINNDVLIEEQLLNYGKTLISAKADVNGLNVYDLLRKDYKEWNVDKKNGKTIKVGISSVSVPLDQWIKITGEDVNTVQHSFTQWKNEKKLDILIVMTAFKDSEGIFTRELAIYPFNGLNEIEMDQLNNKLELNTCETEINVSLKSVENLLKYKQGKTTMSRKQVAPVLIDILST
jgi:exopolyphosphatase